MLVIRLVAPAFVFPGPVLGMLILLLVLIYRGHLPRGLDAASGGLIGILSLLFVPSAVGIIQYGGLIAGWGGPLVLAVLISTLATLIVTVCVFVWVSRWTEPDQS